MSFYAFYLFIKTYYVPGSQSYYVEGYRQANCHWLRRNIIVEDEKEVLRKVMAWRRNVILVKSISTKQTMYLYMI